LIRAFSGKNTSSIVVDRREDLAGLSDNQIAAASAAAKDEHKEGKFVLRLQNTTGQPCSVRCKTVPCANASCRPRSRVIVEGGPFDTREIIIRTAHCERNAAKLLGYENHAAYQLEDQTAKDVSTVNKLLADLAVPRSANARREAADMQKIVDQEKGGFQIASWDWDFYSERVRKARYQFDESDVRPYYEVKSCPDDGVFFCRRETLWSHCSRSATILPVLSTRRARMGMYDADGQPLALFLGDYYARAFQARRRVDERIMCNKADYSETKPVVANHLNIPKPPQASRPCSTAR
jgi:peptidyl-dipeptidase Dcp